MIYFAVRFNYSRVEGWSTEILCASTDELALIEWHDEHGDYYLLDDEEAEQARIQLVTHDTIKAVQSVDPRSAKDVN